MGRRILVRKRGHAAPQFRAPSKGKIAPAKYPFLPDSETMKGVVQDIIHERGRGAPLAQIRLEDGRFIYLPAVSGLTTGCEVVIGSDAEVKEGSVLQLSRIPEGTVISNMEKTFGDGGRFARAPGAYALLFSQTTRGAVVRMPSGKSLLLSGRCRATLGRVAGEGRSERPFLRAGSKFHAMKARGRVYPRVRGVAMAAVHHPFGGGRHQHPGKSTSTARGAPPGRKVGHIAPRKTGRKRTARPTISRGGQ